MAVLADFFFRKCSSSSSSSSSSNGILIILILLRMREEVCREFCVLHIHICVVLNVSYNSLVCDASSVLLLHCRHHDGVFLLLLLLSSLSRSRGRMCTCNGAIIGSLRYLSDDDDERALMY